jgi:hypothetical protein
MARNSSQIKWMPAYKADDDRIIDHYRRALGKKCDRRRAAQLLKQDRDHYWRDKEGSRIQYDKLTDTWRGREVGLPGPKFGVVRDRNPKLLRNILRENIGINYFTKGELKELFAKLFGSEKVKSKFTQARNKEIIKFSPPVWHLSTTPPPDALYVHQEATVVQATPIDPAEPAGGTSEKPSCTFYGLDHKPAVAAPAPALEQKSAADLEKERFDAEVEKIELLAVEKWDEHEAGIRGLERDHQARQHRLFTAATPLRYYPGSSDITNLMDYISTFCDLSEFGWAEVLQLAKGSGYLKQDEETGFRIGQRIEAGCYWDGSCWRFPNDSYDSSEPYWAIAQG